MVRKQYPVLELANQMPVRIWIWTEPLVAPRVRRALGTRIGLVVCLEGQKINNMPNMTSRNLLKFDLNFTSHWSGTKKSREIEHGRSDHSVFKTSCE